MSFYDRLNLRTGDTFTAAHVGHLEAGIQENEVKLNDFDATVRSINHRGYSVGAPENTLPAFALSKKMGFKYVEADVTFTKDNVAVMIHDDTIDRTSNGSGKVSSLNYTDLLKYDFGSWMGAEFTGTPIPTFSEFIKLCRKLGLHPYIEVKHSGTYTQEQVNYLVNEVILNGMRRKVTWISYNVNYLTWIKTADPTSRIGLLHQYTVDDTAINNAKSLRTEQNEVFLALKSTQVNDSAVQKCIAAELPLETWTVDDETTMLNLPAYVTGIISNNLNGGRVLYGNGINLGVPGSDAPGGYLDYPLININMANGTNIGTGGAAYNATLYGSSSFKNGKFVASNSTGYLNIPIDFIPNKNSQFTLFFVFDNWNTGSAAYGRFFHFESEVPSIFITKETMGVRLKLVNTLNKANAEYYNPSLMQIDGTSTCYGFPVQNGEKMVIAVRCDGTRYSIWRDGKLAATMLCSVAEPTNATRNVLSIGDSVQNYPMASLECSKIMVWDKALSDEEMKTLIS